MPGGRGGAAGGDARAMMTPNRLGLRIARPLDRLSCRKACRLARQHSRPGPSCGAVACRVGAPPTRRTPCQRGPVACRLNCLLKMDGHPVDVGSAPTWASAAGDMPVQDSRRRRRRPRPAGRFFAGAPAARGHALRASAATLAGRTPGRPASARSLLLNAHVRRRRLLPQPRLALGGGLPADRPPHGAPRADRRPLGAAGPRLPRREGRRRSSPTRRSPPRHCSSRRPRPGRAKDAVEGGPPSRCC